MTTLGVLLLAQALGTVRHHFVFVSDKPAKSVSLAGTFNSWNKDATPMKAEADGRTWSVDLDLKYGRYYYKFVRDGEEWLTDPKAAKNEDDGNGNINSLLMIVPPDFSNPAKRGDGMIASSAIATGASLPYFNVDGETASVLLRTRLGDIKTVTAEINNKRIATTIDHADDVYEYHRADFPWNRKQDLSISFVCNDGKTNEVFPSKPIRVVAKTYRPFEVPVWVEGSVIYQIFPDRFENGDRSNDPKDVMPWDAKPTWYNRFGGDVAGVEKRMGYLKDLGITAIYFNPIFKSPSNHRYEADDYMVVDPQFGTNAEFKKLTSDLKRNGISTILDFAFNHTSPGTKMFQDLIKNGANSPYKNWYFPKSFPIKVGENPNYEAWYGFPSMPKLNTVNPATRDYLLSVCKYWIQDVGIRGMRLDVANEVDMNFWRVMRPYVKSLNPTEWIVGEIWGDGNPWLQGDQFDSVMNYQFRDAAIRFVAKGSEDAAQFAASLMRVHKSYPPQVSRNMMNLLGSHDTPRFLTECGGDRDLAKLGAAIQFTWIGEPSIYYGDELGMEGGKDPDNRYGMDWKSATQDNDMLRFYKKLIQVRKTTNAFSTGDAEFIETSGQTGAFARVGEKDAAVVAFNRSDQAQTISINVPPSVQKLAKKGLFDAFTGTAYKAPARPIEIKVKPKSFAILVSRSFSNTSLSHGPSAKRDSVQRRANLNTRSQTKS
ncbi:MAG: alpha-glucosidase C-terminal domain-containing protein [Armatimonadetes bacterium]|nr:alpha-glucosidase C-terminal domain-containing protein [Armatimonadota bacterium]